MNVDPVLLVNLGSPESPSMKDVRVYLEEFLMDERVIDRPAWFRYPLVHGIILPRRTGHAARLYETIWTPEGSPLVVHGVRLAARLAEMTGRRVEIAMRYGHPSVGEALTRLVAGGVKRVSVVPLFPQYAEATVGSAVAHLRTLLATAFPGVGETVIQPYYADPGFIRALVEQARFHLEPGFDHLLLSFHSLPERQIRKADPTRRRCLSTSDCCRGENPALATCYRAQCLRTAEALVAALGVEPGRVSIAYQSKMGRGRWLGPSTESEIRRLAGAGVRRLAVMAPSFAADCLETLEELGVRGRRTFREAGGGDFILVPSLNDHPAWVEALAGMIRFPSG